MNIFTFSLTRAGTGVCVSPEAPTTTLGGVILALADMECLMAAKLEACLEDCPWAVVTRLVLFPDLCDDEWGGGTYTVAPPLAPEGEGLELPLALEDEGLEPPLALEGEDLELPLALEDEGLEPPLVLEDEGLEPPLLLEGKGLEPLVMSLLTADCVVDEWFVSFENAEEDIAAYDADDVEDVDVVIILAPRGLIGGAFCDTLLDDRCGDILLLPAGDLLGRDGEVLLGTEGDKLLLLALCLSVTLVWVSWATAPLELVIRGTLEGSEFGTIDEDEFGTAGEKCDLFFVFAVFPDTGLKALFDL